MVIDDSRYRPDPRHPRLGAELYDAVQAASFEERTLRFRNQRWAQAVGLGGLSEEQWLATMAGFAPLPDNLPEPLALRYHGHQFQSYNPALGDGRGFLYAQLRDDRGRLLDLGTKGSGQTPYSRGGDGRLTLKGGVREILATEMLEARGVDTSKTLSVVETHESLTRHDEPSPTRSCVLVRLSHGHVRIGTFQRLAFLRQHEALQRLLDHSLEHYHPRVAQAEDRAAAFLDAVVRACAETTAAWMCAGFVHGVLNTDNINITGESFDYGPWRFAPRCEPRFTAAYFDHSGLYAFGRQPAAVFWDLEQLANALVPVGKATTLSEALMGFRQAFGEAFVRQTVATLGLAPAEADADKALTDAWWKWLEESGVAFDQPWFDWYGGADSEARARRSEVRYAGPEWAAVWRHLRDRSAARPDALADPYFQQPRPESLLIEEVEALWDPIAYADDWGPLEDKIARIRARGRAYGCGGPTPC